MTLLAGDLTTPARVQTWLPDLTSASNAIVAQLISSMTALLYTKLNRARTFSQTFTRTIDGVGNYQILLPDYPVTGIASVQLGARIINLMPLPNPTTGVIPPPNFGYGYRFIPWAGNLPGDPAVLEFVNGAWLAGVQNIKVAYTAGYLEQSEPATLPGTGGFSGGTASITVLQPQGIWCRDNGVVYASTGVALTPVSAITAVGQYIPPQDTSPGAYTFGVADANAAILISYSFIPADLEEACIQMVAERYSYRSRVGIIDKSLGCQETMRFWRGGGRYQMFPELPPEVEALIMPYVSVLPPAIGAPV